MDLGQVLHVNNILSRKSPELKFVFYYSHIIFRNIRRLDQLSAPPCFLLQRFVHGLSFLKEPFLPGNWHNFSGKTVLSDERGKKTREGSLLFEIEQGSSNSCSKPGSLSHVAIYLFYIKIWLLCMNISKNAILILKSKGAFL